MKTFKSFDIKVMLPQAFVGTKVRVSKILNRKIIVHRYKIEISKQFGGQCLYLQIEVDSVMHVIFTGSAVMIDSIVQVPEGGLPFSTTIIEDNNRYLFT